MKTIISKNIETKEAAKKFPDVNPNEVVRFFQNLGFNIVGDSKHVKMRHTSGKMVVMPKSFLASKQSNSKNILEYLLKEVGILPADFGEFLRIKSKNPIEFFCSRQNVPDWLKPSCAQK